MQKLCNDCDCSPARKNFLLVGVVPMTFIECFNAVCINLPHSGKSFFDENFDVVCREMEIINGIKLHAIISFDSVLTSCSLFACFAVTKSREESKNSNKDIFKCFEQRSLEHFSFFSVIPSLKTFKCHFYSFS